MKLRISIDILIALAILNGWWFAALPLALIGMWRFPAYIEILIAGVAYDALFGFNQWTGILGYLGTLVSASCVMFILILKKVMR